MGRPPCCDKSNVKRGLWTAEEDAKILAYVSNHGVGNWTLVPKKAGLNRCGKSCRLRWTNYLRPDLRHDSFSPQEEELIVNLHRAIGSRWSLIAKQLPGRTDNDVKNYWNTKLRKKLSKMGIDPITHKPFSQILFDYGNISRLPNQTRPFNRNLNESLILKSEPSSIFSGPPNANNMVTKPSQELAHYNSSWDSISQFQRITPEIMQPQPRPHFLDEVTSSCSSSSACNVPHLCSSPESYSCQQSQAQIQPSLSFSWSEYLLHDTLFPCDYQKQNYFQGAAPSTLEQSKVAETIKSADGNELFGSVAMSCGSTTKVHQSETSSSMNTFVDSILDHDYEMHATFPELLDGYFDY